MKQTIISQISIRVQIKRPTVCRILNTFLTNSAAINFFLLLSSETLSSFFSFQVRIFVLMCAEFCSNLWKNSTVICFFLILQSEFLFHNLAEFAQILDKFDGHQFFLLLRSEFLSMFAEFWLDSWRIRRSSVFLGSIQPFYLLTLGTRNFWRIFPSTKVRNLMPCQFAKSLIPQIPHYIYTSVKS